MNRRLAAIEAKRAVLIERAARERGDVADIFQLWSHPLGLVDRCLAAISFVVARPPLIAAAVIALLVLRPRLAWRWSRRAFGLWQTYRLLMKNVAA